MNDYRRLYSQAKNALNNIPNNKQFLLRDLIDNPPIKLGAWLYRDVASKKLGDVVHIGKDFDGTNIYKKYNFENVLEMGVLVQKNN